MTDLSLLTACVVDHGLFLPLAQRLAQEFGRVLYFSPWEEAADIQSDVAAKDLQTAAEIRRGKFKSFSE